MRYKRVSTRGEQHRCEGQDQAVASDQPILAEGSSFEMARRHYHVI